MVGSDGRRSEVLIADSDVLDVLFDSGADFVALMSLDGRMARVNAPGLSALEIEDPAEVIGADWASLWTYAHRDKVGEALRQAAAGEVAKFHGLCPTASGKPKWWDVTVTPLRTGGSKLVGLLATARDVSDHAAIRHGLVSFRDGVVAGWSTGAQAIYGWSAEEVIGRPMTMLLPDRLHARCTAWADGFFATGDLGPSERSMSSYGLRRNGEEFPIDCVFEVLPSDGGWILLASVQSAGSSKDRIELFENAFQSAPIGMALVGLDGRFLKLNPAFCALVGYDEGQLLASDFQSITYADDLETDEARVAQLVAGEIADYQMDKRYLRADGSQVWVNLSVSLVRFADGRPKFFVSQVQDLTARREAEARYRVLAENVNDMVGLYDDDGRCLYVSPSVERLLGYTPEQFLGRNPMEFVPQRGHPGLLANRNVFAGVAPGETITLQHQMLHSDGREIWVEAACRKIVDESGRIVTAAATRDITDRLETERLYRLIADTTEDILVLADLDGRVSLVAGACERILGWPVEDAMGPDRKTRVHPEDQAQVMEFLHRLRRGESGLQFRYRSLCKDGSWRWLESRPSLLFDEAGSPTGFVDSVRDVTAQVVQEQELAKAREEAEAAAQAKARFLANMSHEIRTPLTSVIGFSDLLLARGDLQADVHHHAERINSASRALLTVVNDVLDFSKIEAGQFEIHATPADAAEVARDAIAIFASAAEAKGVGLRLETKGRGPMHVQIDAARVRQVLLNLIGNAVKFTERGEVVVRLRCAGERIFVAVQDSGPGIEPDDQRKLFQRFSQVDASTTRQHGGTGLGLAICKGLVEAMGGSIALSSRPGHGSTFSFEIEAPAVAEAAAFCATPEGETHIERVRVLVADDNPVNRELARAILEGFGCEVVEAADGGEALLIAASARYDVILMDLRMPRLDGHGALRQLRATPGPNQHTPVLAFTADVVEAAVDRFDGAIAKPIEPQRLAAAIEACLARPGARQADRAAS